jgi:hypothetical protein
MMRDIGGTILTARAIVQANPSYEQYMLMGWSPLLFEPALARDGAQEVALPEGRLADALSSQICGQVGSVEQTRYGVNEITYRVSLGEPKLMVENEIYFPGWRADLLSADGGVQLEALAVNDVFRAWALPAGDYEMRAHFRFPNAVAYRAVSLSAFVAWLSVASSGLVKRRREARQPATLLR